MYVVIAFQGHQYIVKQWDEIVVDRLEGKEGDSLTIDTVLLSFDEAGKKVAVGTPHVAKANVTAKIKNHTKGDKIRVFKFQWKKRYHRTKWFTPQKTTLTIDNVVHG